VIPIPEPWQKNIKDAEKRKVEERTQPKLQGDMGRTIDAQEPAQDTKRRRGGAHKLSLVGIESRIDRGIPTAI
jgi:hypothetical protein